MSTRALLFVLALVVLWFVADGIGSAFTLADHAARPVSALARSEADGTERRVSVWTATPGAFGQPEGTARVTGGRGIPLGYAYDFGLPGGDSVSCTHILRWLWCGGGWRAERPAA